MAVYSRVDQAELNEFLKQYNIGALVSFEGILQGVENSNYHLFTDHGRYILTIFEKRVGLNDLPFIFDVMEKFAIDGITCPAPIKRRDGQTIGTVQGKPAAILSFLPGNNIDPAQITPKRCADMGGLTARLHRAGEKIKTGRANTLSLKGWRDLIGKIGDQADIFRDEMTHLESAWPRDLPTGAVHADLFPDNIFEIDGTVSGVIDFYFTCIDSFAYDLALVINAWCFDEQYRFVPERFTAMISAYQSIRPLTQAERASFQTLCRGAALRILLTRLHDKVFHDPSVLVTPKNPAEYELKLDFHRYDDIING